MKTPEEILDDLDIASKSFQMLDFDKLALFENTSNRPNSKDESHSADSIGDSTK